MIGRYEPKSISNMTETRPPFEDPVDTFLAGLTKFYSTWVSLTYPFACKHSNLSIHYTVTLKRVIANQIALGNSVSIAKDAWLNVPIAVGGTPRPVLVIGDRCTIGQRCQVSGKNLIHLGSDVILSPSVLIMDHSHAYEDVTVPISQQNITQGGRIHIGEGSWIGFGAAIICTRGKLTLGRHCVVGANSVVTRSFPSYSVIAGNPAVLIKHFDPLTQTWQSRCSSPRFALGNETSIKDRALVLERTLIPSSKLAPFSCSHG